MVERITRRSLDLAPVPKVVLIGTYEMRTVRLESLGKRALCDLRVRLHPGEMYTCAVLYSLTFPDPTIPTKMRTTCDGRGSMIF